MAEQKHTLEDLRVPHTGEYPKAMYKSAVEGAGDIKSPGYEKIVMNDSGMAQRKVEYHFYVSISATDESHEKKLIKDGWVDHVSKIKNGDVQ